MKYFASVFILASVALMTGCSSAAITTTQKSLPEVYVNVDDSHQEKREIKITLFRLNNYTDTPRAGLRAANIVEGILLSRGYKIKSRLNEKTPSLKKARKIAKEDGSDYFMYGGVSEWRYKTGIDGEPAVSVQLSLYKTKNGKLKWSATGSDNDWGNASIGTTAQNLLETMMTKE
ncbi:MAG: hypothetical protein GXO11_04960 [Epsilonproteobacteria bacterium]|nr:hypothetical protein [Campylobacterota bacterium]